MSSNPSYILYTHEHTEQILWVVGIVEVEIVEEMKIHTKI